MKIIMLFVFCTVFLSGCAKESVVSVFNACSLEDKYTVKFTGQAFGFGDITFTPLNDGQEGVGFQITLIDQAQALSEPMLRIKGVGQCVDGVVKGQFGSGVSYKPTVKVLGGEFIGVFKHTNIDSPFGKWEIALFDSEQDKTFDLDGFWEYSTKAITLASKK